VGATERVIEVLSAATADGRAEFIATIRHHGQNYKIALLDITLDADPTTARSLGAYSLPTAAGQADRHLSLNHLSGHASSHVYQHV
jgi:hypothetical protein